MATNNGPNALHGGIAGFDKMRWDILSVTDTRLVMQYISRDGFDVRTARVIGSRIGENNEQRHCGDGYDHNFMLDGVRDMAGMVHAARVIDPVSGRTLDVHSTEPGIQFHFGNVLDGSITGKGGAWYGPRTVYGFGVVD